MQSCFDVKKVDCDTCEKISHAMKSMLFMILIVVTCWCYAFGRRLLFQVTQQSSFVIAQKEVREVGSLNVPLQMSWFRGGNGQ